MAELDGVLVLDTGDAESKIEALGTLFDTITTGFAQSLAEALDQLTTVPEPELETAGLTESVATAMAVGAGEGAAAIESAVANVEAPPVEIVVEADTAAAEAEIDGLANSAEEATISVGGLAGGTTALAAGAGAAVGDLSALEAGVGGLSTGAKAAVGGLTAVAAAAFVMTQSAIDAEGATQRFEQTLGAFADEVEHLRGIEGLNTNLAELAINLGSDDDALRNAASSATLFQQASGRGRAESALFAQQIAVLAARAVALNPGLGEVGDAAERLVGALASGRERALLPFQLGLTQAQIRAEALSLGLADTAEELTRADLAFAGASLAADKFGATLEGDIARGQENTIIRQRALRQRIEETIEALGAPLIVPLFEIMEEAQPAVEALGEALVEIVQAGLPTFLTALKVLVPILETFSSIIRILGPGLEILIPALVAAKVASLALAAAEGLLAHATAAVTVNMVGFAATSETAAVAATSAGLSMSSAVPAIAAFTAAFLITTKVLGWVVGGSKDLTDELKNVDSAVSSLAGAVDAELVPAFGRAVKAQKDLLREQGNATEKTIRLGAEIRTFTLIAKDDLGVAIRLAEQYKDNVVVYAAFQAILARVAAARRQANADSAAAQHLIGAEADAYQALIDGVAGSTNTAVPQMGEVMATFASNVKDAFGDEGVTALSMQDYIDNLNQTATETQTWLDQIEFLTAAGLEGVAAAIATEGPGGALGKEVATAGAEANVAWNDQLEAVGATLALQGEKQKALSAATAAGIIDPYKKVPGAIGLELADVDVAIMEAMRAASDVSYRAGQDVGGNLADGVAQGIESKQDYINRILAGTIANAKLWAEGYAGISSPSKLFAKDIGVPISQGIALGIMQASGAVNTAVTATVAGALPSFTMRDTIGAAARVGAQGALGLTGGSMIDHSITVGSITNIGADPDSRARSLVRELRSFQYLGG